MSDDEEDDSLHCSICSSLLVEAVTTPCAHNFCKAHLAAWISQHANGQPPTCPLDRLPIQRTPEELMVNRALQSLVDKERRRRATACLSALDIPWKDIRFTRNEEGDRETLGSGVAGVVYACEWSFQECALKQLHQALCKSAAFIESVRHEAALQRSMAHMGIVAVHGVAVDTTTEPSKPKYGILMARMWKDLQDVLQEVAEAGNADAALPLPWRLHALHQVAAGLAHLHARKVAHGDLKPLNIMLTSPEKGCTLALTDFGFARVSMGVGAGGGSVLEGGALQGRGTVRWMAPELLAPPPAGGKVVAPGALSDVFSLAVVAWQILACQADPYSGLSDPQVTMAVTTGGKRPNLSLLPPGVPSGLRELLEASWGTTRTARPFTAGAFLERLREVAPDPGASFPLALFPPSAARGGGGKGGGGGGGGGGASSGSPPTSATTALLPWAPRALTGATCPVCDRPDSAMPSLPLRCRKAHAMCMECALHTLRQELKPTAVCIRCPVCLAADAPNAPPKPVDLGAVLELAAWSRSSARPAAPASSALRPMGDEEVMRVREISARSAAAAAAAAAAASAPAQEAPPPEHLFRRCPGCGTGVQKPRGHHCHHISPGTGCTNCGACPPQWGPLPLPPPHNYVVVVVFSPKPFPSLIIFCRHALLLRVLEGSQAGRGAQHMSYRVQALLRRDVPLHGLLGGL